MGNQNKLRSLLLVFFAVEVFTATYGLKAIPLLPLFSILYLFSGIGIAVLALRMPGAGTRQLPSGLVPKPFVRQALLTFIVMAFVCWLLAKYTLHAMPLDLNTADMLPVINVMNHRFIHGQWNQVYDVIPEIWRGTRPVYLPGIWLPFSLPQLLDIDPRWVTVCCVIFIFGLATVLCLSARRGVHYWLTAALGFVLLWWLLTENETHGFISLSEEGVVGLYYVLLVTAIASERKWLMAMAISLCLLSRYALIGWLPAVLVYFIWFRKTKYLVTLAVLGPLMLFLLFVIPFGWGPLLRLLQLPGYYVDFAKRVWKDNPQVFTGNLGMAKFFGPQYTANLHYLLVLLSFNIPFAFMLICIWKCKSAKLSNIPLATLKIAVVIFYNFIDVPYPYLFYTSSFISLYMVVILTRNISSGYSPTNQPASLSTHTLPSPEAMAISRQ